MDLCPACLQDLPWLGPCCRRCARPLNRGEYCGGCATAVLPFSHSLAALSYEYPVTTLITGLKYQKRIECARVLAELLAIALREARLDSLLPWPDLLLPVPLHPRRLAQRGYNQAELLARWLGAILQVPCGTQVLARRRDTPPQVSLSRAARLENLRGAFVVRDSLAGKSVALIDDVLTTGATARALAGVVQDAGAATVQVWVAARTGS